MIQIPSLSANTAQNDQQHQGLDLNQSHHSSPRPRITHAYSAPKKPQREDPTSIRFGRREVDDKGRPLQRETHLVRHMIHISATLTHPNNRSEEDENAASLLHPPMSSRLLLQASTSSGLMASTLLSLPTATTFGQGMPIPPPHMSVDVVRLDDIDVCFHHYHHLWSGDVNPTSPVHRCCQA